MAKKQVTMMTMIRMMMIVMMMKRIMLVVLAVANALVRKRAANEKKSWQFVSERSVTHSSIDLIIFNHHHHHRDVGVVC